MRPLPSFGYNKDILISIRRPCSVASSRAEQSPRLAYALWRDKRKAMALNHQEASDRFDCRYTQLNVYMCICVCVPVSVTVTVPVFVCVATQAPHSISMKRNKVAVAVAACCAARRSPLLLLLRRRRRCLHKQVTFSFYQIFAYKAKRQKEPRKFTCKTKWPMECGKVQRR